MTGQEGAPARVLLVGTDGAARDEARDWLAAADRAVAVTAVAGAEAARAELAAGPVDCVAVVGRANEGEAVALAEALEAADRPVVLAAPGVTERASAAIEAGATDCIDRSTAAATPALFARRLDVAADAGRHRRGDIAGRPYRDLFEQVPEPAAIIQDGAFVRVNERSTDLLGADRETIEGTAVMAVAPAAEKQEVARRFRRLQETDVERVPYVDREIVAFDGEDKHIQVSSGSITYRGGPAILITARDVTERREREQRLLSYETMVETIGDVVYTLDGDYHFRLVAGAVEAVTGYTAEELEGAHISRLLSEADIQRGRDSRAAVVDGDRETGSIDVTVHRKDGTTVPVEVRYRSLPEPDDASRGTAGVIRDVSAREERERRLRRQNERLEEFAGIVSHDLRNPLTVAAGRLEVAREAHDDDNLAAVARALSRMESLVEDTLTLARQGQAVSETEPVDLAEYANNCWLMVATGDATVEVGGGAAASDGGDPALVRADPDRLRQLLENLFRNAVEHGGDGVTVTVEVLEDGFAVADDGPGIAPGRREEVLQPGFTTGEDGSGFGLAIVHTIAQAHGWEVSVTESAAGGARFEVTGVEFV